MKLFTEFGRLLLKAGILFASVVLFFVLLLYAARVTLPLFMGIGLLMLLRSAWLSLTPGPRVRRCRTCSGPWREERRTCAQLRYGQR